MRRDWFNSDRHDVARWRSVTILGHATYFHSAKNLFERSRTEPCHQHPDNSRAHTVQEGWYDLTTLHKASLPVTRLIPRLVSKRLEKSRANTVRFVLRQHVVQPG